MSKVYLVHDAKLGKFPATWSLWRVGTGPGRGEGQGFKTKAEASEWAKQWGHTIIKKWK